MCSESGFDMQAQPFSGLLNWLRSYYRPHEGVFRTQEKTISNFVRHIAAIRRDYEDKFGNDYWSTIAKTSAPVLRYHLYHLIEDDWLTYYLTRLAVNMAERDGDDT